MESTSLVIEHRKLILPCFSYACEGFFFFFWEEDNKLSYFSIVVNLKYTKYIYTGRKEERKW